MRIEREKWRRRMQDAGSGAPVTDTMLTLATEFRQLQSKWQTLSLYERFEQTVVAALTLVIALIVVLATWQLLGEAGLLWRGAARTADPQIFQGVFGMVLTVLIALEFKHTLLVVRHHRRAVIEVRSVVLIALLALVRRFIILDVYEASPGIIAALAGATVALGIVFWLVADRSGPEVEAEAE
jgi:uncharacterized membrane protein (DUF373 family)